MEANFQQQVLHVQRHDHQNKFTKGEKMVMNFIRKYGYRIGMFLLVTTHAYMAYDAYFNHVGLDWYFSLYHGILFLVVAVLFYLGEKTSLF